MPSPRSLLCRLAFLFAIAFVAPNEGIASETAIEKVFKASCIECHSGSSPDGSFSIEPLLAETKLLVRTDSWVESGLDTKSWERILRKLRAGQMPPPHHEKPSSELLQAASKEMERGLKLYNDTFPSIAKTPGLRRLTRTEYQNAIKDLLGIPVDAASYYPRMKAVKVSITSQSESGRRRMYQERSKRLSMFRGRHWGSKNWDRPE